MVGPQPDRLAHLGQGLLPQPVFAAPLGEPQALVRVVQVGTPAEEAVGGRHVWAELQHALAGDPGFADRPAHAVLGTDALDVPLQRALAVQDEDLADGPLPGRLRTRGHRECGKGYGPRQDVEGVSHGAADDSPVPRRVKAG